VIAAGAGGRPFVVGVISDTHGVLPDVVEAVFAGVDAIVHAGDVGSGAVLDLLGAIAPVTAVCGLGTFHGEHGLPAAANVRFGGVRFVIGHSKDHLLADVHAGAAGAGVVVTGHTHRARAARHAGVWYVNPGSASQGRGRPCSVALVTVCPDGAVDARILRLPEA
jgi:putative phosphoesterase